MQRKVRSGVALGLILTLVGCGGGGSGGGSGATEQLVLKPGVSIADDNAPFQVVSTAPNTVTVSGDASGLVPGTLLVSGEGAGFLRLVDSVVPQGANTLINTSQGTLDDAFQEASFKRQVTIGPEQIAEFVPAAPGITMDPPNAPGRGRGDTLEISLTLVDFELDSNGPAKLSVSGSISIGLGFDFDVKWGAGQKYVKAAFQFSASAEASLKAALAKSIAHKKIPLGVLIGNPIPILVFGFPIVVVPTINLYAEFDGTVKVGANLTSQASVKAELGVVYNNGNFDLVADLDPSASLVPKPNFYSSLSFRFTPVKVDAFIAIYGIAGPYASCDLPRLELSFTQQANPAGLHVGAGAVFEGSTGLKMNIFGRNLLDKEYPLAISQRINFLDRFFPNNGGVDVEVK
ncbi:MAG: hypothetical protein H7Y17_15995 [Chlorobia bacterium]|nr:hypothetical protein [Fimbriimonadaceae bacterium]